MREASYLGSRTKLVLPGRMLRSRAVLIFAGTIAALLTFGAMIIPASAGTWPSYPAALGAFNPNGVVPGRWHLVARTSVLYENSGLLAGCRSAGARWQEADGTQISLIWAACDQQEIKLLSTTYAATRTRIPVTWRNLSVLGPDVDLVRADADGTVWRFWLQGDLSLTLVSICPHLSVGPCAALSAPAAQDLAARLPGQPVVTKVTSVLPPASPLFGSLALLWLVFVGGSRLHRRAKLEKFQMGPDNDKLRRVDQEADELRKVSRRRSWARLLVTVGVIPLAAGIAGSVRQVPAQAAGDVVAGLLLCGAGVVMLRRFRHPLLARTRYASRGSATEAATESVMVSVTRSVTEALHPRRLLSAGFTLFLSLMTLLIPLGVLAAWILAGLASATQDLSEPLAGLVIAAIVACYFIDRAAQRLRARSLHEAMNRDPGRWMLYLRNFGDDVQKIPTSRFNRNGLWQRSTGWLNPVGDARFEEVLARALAHSGPVVAVGQRGGKMRSLFWALAPTLGAAKTSLDDDEWHDKVRKWATDANTVVVSATPAEVGEGLAWELHTLAQSIEHGHIILIFGTGTRAELHQRFGAFVQNVANYPLFQDLSSGWITDGTLVLVHDPADGWGTWRGWGAEQRTAWTYMAAIGAAMAYAKEAWDRPAAKLIPPSDEPRLTPAVASALSAAAASRREQPIDTKTLLVALMDIDSSGRWDRILLHSCDRNAIAEVGYEDPPGPAYRLGNLVLTQACGRAFETAWRLSSQYLQVPLQLGFLVLGLIADESSAGARALNIDSEDRLAFMAGLVQEDLIGTDVDGLSLSLAPKPMERHSRNQ
jgi:hypothetical protein